MARSRNLPPPHDAGGERSNSSFIRFCRLARLLLHIAYGCFGVAVVFPFFSHRRRSQSVEDWSRQILRILHLRVTIRGSPPLGRAPTLVVSNHVSWLDICILSSVTPLRFVAKSDVRSWPLVGSLASGVGTIFIERGNPLDTVRTNRAIVQALARGEHVAIFPEGTSTDGTEIKPFHASLFQPALEAVARVVVVALRYVNPDGSVNLDASYAGERSLWESFRLVVARRSLRAELIFAANIDVNGSTRADIACAAACAAADALQLPRPGRQTGTVASLPVAVSSTSSDVAYPVRSRSTPAAGPALTDDPG
jgi:1-acyl-sn-glycerol-3-phosphate acyltransferase